VLCSADCERKNSDKSEGTDPIVKIKQFSTVLFSSALRELCVLGPEEKFRNRGDNTSKNLEIQSNDTGNP
jgi:hypothetical protein